MNHSLLALALCTTIVLGACGGGNTDLPKEPPVVASTRGNLLQSPPQKIQDLTTEQISTQWPSLIPFTGKPLCGVQVNYLKYATVAALDVASDATGALMVPRGDNAACSGPRPVVLFAHGTMVFKNFNLAAIDDLSNPAYQQSALLAAGLSAQGFIVVAPNYVGYREV